jgi:creatinine amidohydrolase
MFLNDLKTVDLSPDKKYVFLVSLGALEQHGPFAPLGTDNIIQDRLLGKVEAAVPEVIFLPTIPIGESELQLGFLGSISFQASTLYSMLNDIVRCLFEYSSVIIFVSWHGGNKPVISSFIKEKQVEHPKAKFVQITFGDEYTDVEVDKLIPGGIDDHAGNMEISMSLAARPGITRQPEIGSDKKVVAFDWDKPVLSVAQDGVVDSNPHWLASGMIGDQLYDVFSHNLIKKIRALIS